MKLKIIYFLFILLFSSCSLLPDFCIKAEEFGSYQKDDIIIYSNPYINNDISDFTTKDNNVITKESKVCSTDSSKTYPFHWYQTSFTYNHSKSYAVSVSSGDIIKQIDENYNKKGYPIISNIINLKAYKTEDNCYKLENWSGATDSSENKAIILKDYFGKYSDNKVSIKGEVIEGNIISLEFNRENCHSIREYTYQWYVKNEEEYVAISGATQSTYKVTANDIEKEIKIIVKDINDGNSEISSTTNTNAIFFEGIASLYFNGTDNYYNYDDLLQHNESYGISFVLGGDNISGTIFYINNILDRTYEELYIKNNKLFYGYKTSSDTLITKDTGIILAKKQVLSLVRYKENLIIRLNGIEKVRYQNININMRNTALNFSDLYIAKAGDNEGFFKGYIAEIILIKQNFPHYSYSSEDLKTIMQQDDSFFDQIILEAIEHKLIALRTIEHKLLYKYKLQKEINIKNNIVFATRDGDTIMDQGDLFNVDGSMNVNENNDGKRLLFAFKNPKINYENCPSEQNIKNILELHDLTIEIAISYHKDRLLTATNFIYERFIEPIEIYFFGQAVNDNVSDDFVPLVEKFFKGVVGEGSLLQNVMLILLTIYISFWGIFWLFGLWEASWYQTFTRIMKIAIIVTIFSDNGWNFFEEYVINFFRDGAISIGNIIFSSFDEVTGQFFGNKNALFAVLANILDLFLSEAINGKVWSLLWSPVFLGLIIVVMFYYSFYLFLHIIFKILTLYLSIFIMMSVAFILAPIFILFLLFEKTKGLFDAWLSLLIGYMLQYIFMIATVAIFSFMITSLFYGLFNYTVCVRTVVQCCSFMSKPLSILTFLKPVFIESPYVNPFAQASLIPDFFSMVFFLFIFYIFGILLTFMVDLASKIAGGIGVSGMVSEIAKQTKTDDIGGAAVKIADDIGKKAGGTISEAQDLGARVGISDSASSDKYSTNAWQKLKNKVNTKFGGRGSN